MNSNEEPNLPPSDPADLARWIARRHGQLSHIEWFQRAYQLMRQGNPQAAYRVIVSSLGIEPHSGPTDLATDSGAGAGPRGFSDWWRAHQPLHRWWHKTIVGTLLTVAAICPWAGAWKTLAFCLLASLVTVATTRHHTPQPPRVYPSRLHRTLAASAYFFVHLFGLLLSATLWVTPSAYRESVGVGVLGALFYVPIIWWCIRHFAEIAKIVGGLLKFAAMAAIIVGMFGAMHVIGVTAILNTPLSAVSLGALAGAILLMWWVLQIAEALVKGVDSIGENKGRRLR